MTVDFWRKQTEMGAAEHSWTFR